MFYAAIPAPTFLEAADKLEEVTSTQTAWTTVFMVDPDAPEQPTPQFVFRVIDHPGTMHVEGNLSDFYPLQADLLTDGPLVFIE